MAGRYRRGQWAGFYSPEFGQIAEDKHAYYTQSVFVSSDLRCPRGSLSAKSRAPCLRHLARTRALPVTGPSVQTAKLCAACIFICAADQTQGQSEGAVLELAERVVIGPHAVSVASSGMTQTFRVHVLERLSASCWSASRAASRSAWRRTSTEAPKSCFTLPPESPSALGWMASCCAPRGFDIRNVQSV